MWRMAQASEGQMKKQQGNAQRGQATTTRQRIVDASMTLFAKRGFHGTGIRDIAEEAQLSTATLYHYMGTKEDLLLHIMREANSRLASAAAKAIANSTDPAGHILMLARILVATEATHRLTVVGDTELRVLSPESAREILALRDAHEQQWATAIHAGVQEGTFHIDDEQLARFALIQMCTGVAHWYFPGGRLSLPQIASRYGDMALSLLNASRQGKALSTTSLGLHDAGVEVDLVMHEFESFLSPRARPTHFAMVQRS
jgi:AcrR family transcriptional regulator